MLRGLFLLLIFVAALLAASAQAQPSPAPAADASQKSPNPRPDMLGSPEEEILRRAEIRHAEASYKEMVERADEAALLGSQIRLSFEKVKSLNREDLKKLERMEKLARKIRGGAGGSDDEEELKDPPSQLNAAVTRLADLSEILNKSVQKSSRLVISASVIEHSNEMIELIRHIRLIVQQ